MCKQELSQLKTLSKFLSQRINHQLMLIVETTYACSYCEKSVIDIEEKLCFYEAIK